MSGEVAFELIATKSGAALAWGEPKSGRLLVAFLDEGGDARGEPVRVERTGRAGAEVIEVAAASLDDRVGVAWIDRAGQTTASWGALGDAGTRSFSAALALGASQVEAATRRGAIALSASDKNELVALRRGPDEPCPGDKEKTCAAFAFRELLSVGPQARGLPLSVPSPCLRPLVGFALVKDRWHYALCSTAEGPPVTMAFNVQRTPYYADAKPLLRGCQPIGMLVVEGAVLIAAECEAGRRAVRVGDMTTPVTTLDVSRAELACERGRPRVRIPGEPALAFALDQPMSGLGPILPASLASPGSRAAWTGSRLLVASWARSNVVLRRFGCRGGDLVPE